jgi:hypothetical protein
MIRVRVSDEEGRDSPDVLGHDCRFAFQFQANVEDDPSLGRLHFDAAGTDFLVSSVYDDFHEILESAGFMFREALRLQTTRQDSAFSYHPPAGWLWQGLNRFFYRDARRKTLKSVSGEIDPE